MQLSEFGLNWQTDSIEEKRQTQTTYLSITTYPHTSLHLWRWNKANFEVPEDQLYQGSLQCYVSRQRGTEPHF